jgi:hypothetical protein
LYFLTVPPAFVSPSHFAPNGPSSFVPAALSIDFSRYPMFNTVIISLVLNPVTNVQSIINTVSNVPIQSVTIIPVQTVTNVHANNVQSVINAVSNLLVNNAHYVSNFKSFSNAVSNIPTVQSVSIFQSVLNILDSNSNPSNDLVNSQRKIKIFLQIHLIEHSPLVQTVNIQMTT